MPHYDMKCNFCGREDTVFLPISRDLKLEPLSCATLENRKCVGIMMVQFKTPPHLHGSCIPTRVKNDGVTYEEKG